MSALLPKYGPLPAAMMALTFVAAAPSAHAAGAEAGLYEANTARSAALIPLKDDAESVRLMSWVGHAKTAFQQASDANATVTTLVAARLEEARQGLSVLATWSVQTTSLALGAAAAVNRTMADIAAAPQIELSEAGRTGLSMALAAAQESLRASRTAIETTTLSTGHRLSSFVNADIGAAREARRTLVTQRGGDKEASAGNLYDVFGTVLGIEAGVRASSDWSPLLTAANSAVETLQAERADMAWVQNLQVVTTHLQSLSTDSLEMVALAKATFVRLVGDAAKITATALPVAPSTMTASVDKAAPALSGAIRSFGRRIDYIGFAKRWVVGP